MLLQSLYPLRIVSFCVCLLLGLTEGLRANASALRLDDAELGRLMALPVQQGGRFKPIDSVARQSLMLIRGKSVVQVEGERLSAARWFESLIFDTEAVDSWPIFQVQHPQLRTLLGVEGQGMSLLSVSQMNPFLGAINEGFEQVNPEPQLRTPYENALVRLHASLSCYHELIHSFCTLSKSVITEYDVFEKSIPEGMAAIEGQQAGEPYDKAAMETFLYFTDSYLKLSQMSTIGIAPDQLRDSPHWQNLGQGLLSALVTAQIPGLMWHYAGLRDAYQAGNADAFSAHLDQMEAVFDEQPDLMRGVRLEYAYNQLDAFAWSQWLYLAAFLCAACSWILFPKGLKRLAFLLLSLGLLLHALGIGMRIYISGRPPATNLYSCTVFVCFGAVLMGLFVERFQRTGLATATASLIGFFALKVAHHLGLDGDTLEVLRAVLDTNFWLSTHVVMVSLGYSAVFLAGTLALFYLLRRAVKGAIRGELVSDWSRMVYAVLCFGLLFSFVGTLLGGVWADQSWGRFWGWDPKENGALMIVLWVSIILHARWSRMVQADGLMRLSVAGNIVTAWSFFGTNMLGVGLHSYGFTGPAFWGLLGFVLFHLAIIFLPLRPLELVQSQRSRPTSVKCDPLSIGLERSERG